MNSVSTNSTGFTPPTSAVAHPSANPRPAEAEDHIETGGSRLGAIARRTAESVGVGALLGLVPSAAFATGLAIGGSSASGVAFGLSFFTVPVALLGLVWGGLYAAFTPEEDRRSTTPTQDS